MKSALVRSHRLPVAGALAAAVVLAGAGFSAAAPKAPEEKVQVVHVLAKSQADRTKVNELGLDTTEHGDDSGVEVILHGKSDAAKLRAAGFTWRVEDADLAATMRTARTADQANAMIDRGYLALALGFDWSLFQRGIAASFEGIKR